MIKANDLKEFWNKLAGLQYVVLRNFENMLDDLNHEGDIDLLVNSSKEFVSATDAVALSSQATGYNYQVKMGEDYIPVDLRVVGDGYYDSEWEKRMLETRKAREDFFVLEDESYKYSILYHCVMHKKVIPEKYKEYLVKNNVNGERDLIEKLTSYMRENNYRYTVPLDEGVTINRKMYERLEKRCLMKSRKSQNKLWQFTNALKWVKTNSIENKGIAVTSQHRVIYPEVTGYYIPSLLQWGERELAISYAKYLCSIQKENGSWYDCTDTAPYIFDSAQILKGLVAIRDILPEVDSNIIKGCDWVLSNMQPDGRLTTPSKDAWGDDESFCSELIHVYCLSPIKTAGELFGKPDYLEAVEKILGYYKRTALDRIQNFSLLSHFYAYVMEGLYDLGETTLCRESMERLEHFRNSKGGIPGLNDVPWICSTGLFQLAAVWYKLGELERGNSLFYYALSLQNESGGWYGSYPAPGVFAKLYRGRKRPYYFPKEEISWAVKYFLDALSLKEALEFEKQASSFLNEIDENDGRYQLIKQIVGSETARLGGKLAVCDVGCGKGRYLKRLVADFPENDYFASDISDKVMSHVDYIREKRQGSMTNIAYDDDWFDIVYACESFEHAINIRGAFKELYRITKPGGKLVIIDKPIEKLGKMELYEWEQWISDKDMKAFTEECGGILEIRKSVPYENKDDGLFRAWIITKGI
ncbi:MAG: methyltransferase domain-containing protein [Lachnospiraceae bacterium]|nr:methyltransferase domain-containing protein [Lachnospiraceae bacterium]